MLALLLAGSITHTVTVPPLHVPDTATVQVPGFDQSLGHLDSVTVTASIWSAGTFQVENETPWDLTGPFTFFGGAGGFGNVAAYVDLPVSLSAFDGTLDYAGTSAATVSYSGSDTWATTYPMNLQSLPFYTAPTVTVNVTTWASVSPNVPDVTQTFQADVWSDVTFDVTYNYSDYPQDLEQFCTNPQFLCPCPAPNGAQSCSNSANQWGAHLIGYGTPFLTGTGLYFNATTFLPNTMGILFEGTQGAPSIMFGDGVRCVGGTVRRLGITQTNGPPLGSATYDHVHATGTGLRVYQYWYRNAADFCTPATFNLTNAVGTVWTP